MAIPTPSPDVSPGENYGRLAGMGAAIDAATAQIAARATQMSVAALSDRLAEVSGRLDADVAEIEREVAHVAALVPGSRPGVQPSAFTATPVGADPVGLDPAGALPGGGPYVVPGAGIVALRSPVWLEPDVVWALRVSLARRADVADPNNAAVDVGIQWLSDGLADAGTTLVRRYASLTRASGPQGLTVRVPSLRVGPRPIVAPAGAVAWRPFIRSYGGDGETAIVAIAVGDVTYAGVYAPDVADLAARIRTLEGQIAAGVPFTTPILPSCTVANLPPTGTVGRKIFVVDGRAPSAAGTLEPANGGTGVEATDNGAHWVITGTNQQVQA